MKKEDVGLIWVSRIMENQSENNINNEKDTWRMQVKNGQLMEAAIVSRV